MPIKKTPKNKKQKLFQKMKPKKGFVAIQLCIAVAPNGDHGLFIVDDETPEEAAAEARLGIQEIGSYEERETAQTEATLHLVELYLPVPKRPIVKKAKARSKKIAGPLPKVDEES